MFAGVMLVLAVIGVTNERKGHDDDGRDDANENHNDDN